MIFQDHTRVPQQIVTVVSQRPQLDGQHGGSHLVIPDIGDVPTNQVTFRGRGAVRRSIDHTRMLWLKNRGLRLTEAHWHCSLKPQEFASKSWIETKVEYSRQTNEGCSQSL